MVTPSKSRKFGFKQNNIIPKWRTLLALPILLFATYYSIYSIWGLLFIYWGLSSIVKGEVYLVESIERNKNPVLFWVIAIMWLGFGAMYLLADLFPDYQLTMLDFSMFYYA